MAHGLKNRRGTARKDFFMEPINNFVVLNF